MAAMPGRTDHAGFLAALEELAAERAGEGIHYAPTSDATEFALPATAPRPLASHVSRSAEIGLVRRGSAVVATPGQVCRLTPGQIIVIGYGVHHAEYPGSFTAPHRTFWCHLFPEQVAIGEAGFHPNREATHTALSIPTPPQAERIAQDICAELSMRSWGYPHVVQGLLTELAVLLARRIRRGQIVSEQVRGIPPPASGEKAWMAVEAALQFCAVSFRADISRDDIARAVGYSPGHLGRLVSTRLGHSLSEHLTNLRVSEAKRLLTDSDIPVHHIAPLVGYADPAHFTRAFTRATGVSPTAFRREAQARPRGPGR